MAKNMQSVDNNDNELDLNVKDFVSTSLHPVKMNKQFIEELVSVLKDQFSSLKTSFVDLQTSVNGDVKQLAVTVNEAVEVATAAKTTADANVEAINNLKSQMRLEIDDLKSDLLYFKNELNTVNTDNKELKQKNVKLESDLLETSGK